MSSSRNTRVYFLFKPCMNSVLRKILRIAAEKNLPVVVYDSQSEQTGVLMDLDYFESHFDSGSSWDDDVEIEDDVAEESPAFSPLSLQSEEEEDLDELNKNLALWKAQREEKERQEIEKTLEEELIENPPADPFEEDYLHTPEWHKIGDILEIDKKTPDSLAKEPSYHPVINSGGSLTWTDWTMTPNSLGQKSPETIILQEIEEEILPEEGEAEPVFLEEPV